MPGFLLFLLCPWMNKAVGFFSSTESSALSGIWFI
jgi:hypothetical protein